MSDGNPYLITNLGRAPAFNVGYGERGWFGNQQICFESFVRLLEGTIRLEATLPVRVSDRYPIRRGIRW